MLSISCLCNTDETLISTAETIGYIYITPASFPSWIHGQQEAPPMLRKPFSFFQLRIDFGIEFIHTFYEIKL